MFTILFILTIVGFIVYNNSKLKNKVFGKTIGKKQEEPKQKDTFKSYMWGSIKSNELLTKKLHEIKDDFYSAPYRDKLNESFGYKSGNSATWVYIFENNRKIIFKSDANDGYWLCDYKDMKSIKIGIMRTMKIIVFFKAIEKNAKIRQGSGKKTEYSTFNDSYSQSSKKTQKLETKESKLETVYKLRKEQLSKMSKIDPDRVGLENELKVVERKLKETKKK